MQGGDVPENTYKPRPSLLKTTRDICGDDVALTAIAASGSRRVWSLGPGLVVKEWLCPHADGAAEANAARLLQDRGVSADVPVPAVQMHWKDGDWAYTVSARLPGRPLSAVWGALPAEDRRRVAEQTARMVRRLREVESSVCCAFDGGPVGDVNLQLRSGTPGGRGSGGAAGSFGPLSTDDEVWEQMFKPRLDAAGVDGERQRALRECMPPSGPPYAFTHGDLSFGNILVEEGGEQGEQGKQGGVQVSGILDFEFSAYLPRWWEYVAAQFGCCGGDGEWKALLREYMEPDEHAVDWFLYWSELCKTPMPEDIDIWPQILAKHKKTDKPRGECECE